jgi:hypothetical protein
LLQVDRERACKGLEDIETDLIFEIIEAYGERRLEDMAGALLLTLDLMDVRRNLCRRH